MIDFPLFDPKNYPPIENTREARRCFSRETSFDRRRPTKEESRTNDVILLVFQHSDKERESNRKQENEERKDLRSTIDTREKREQRKGIALLGGDTGWEEIEN